MASRPFTIYLLKSNYSIREALNNTKQRPATLNTLPDGYTLYLFDNIPQELWWKDYLGITSRLEQVQKGAILFIQTSGRIFAVTFGSVYHKINKEAFKYDFGLIVTLNSIDPDKIKRTDANELKYNRKLQIQLPNASDLTFFDIDIDVSIVNKLEGRTRKIYKAISTSISGQTGIKIKSTQQHSSLGRICRILLKLYNKNTYRTTFPHLNSMQRVLDPSVLTVLNNELVNSLNNRNPAISLSVPEVVDNMHFYRFSRDEQFDDEDINNYYSSLDSRGIDDVDFEALKKQKISVITEDGYVVNEYKVYNCLLFDYTLDGKSYYLYNGAWYDILSDYIALIDASIQDHYLSDYIFPNYIHTTHNNEAGYNQVMNSISADGATINVICLDRTNIAPTQNIEPCDIYWRYASVDVLCHIKRYRSSQSLSHLFNQGYNSISLIRNDIQAKNNFESLINQTITNNTKIIYGIITDKDPSARGANLPLFSKISLYRILKNYRHMGIQAGFTYIAEQ